MKWVTGRGLMSFGQSQFVVWFMSNDFLWPLLRDLSRVPKANVKIMPSLLLHVYAVTIPLILLASHFCHMIQYRIWGQKMRKCGSSDHPCTDYNCHSCLKMFRLQCHWNSILHSGKQCFCMQMQYRCLWWIRKDLCQIILHELHELLGLGNCWIKRKHATSSELKTKYYLEQK